MSDIDYADDNRAPQYHSDAVKYDPHNAEGALPVQLDPNSGPQSLPTQGPKTTFPFGPPSGDSGPVFDGVMESARQGVPSPALTGDVPDPGAGEDGEPMDWNAVAPYEYPEFPKDSHSAGQGLPMPLA